METILKQDKTDIKFDLSMCGDSTLPRHVVILAGTVLWQQNVLAPVTKNNTKQCLWVSDKEIASLSVNQTSFSKINSWLGREQNIVIFDVNIHFNADAFAAICGSVVGGGYLILLMVEKSQWPDYFPSHFGSRLITSILNQPFIHMVEEKNKKNITFTKNNNKVFAKSESQLLDQNAAVNKIFNVVTAPEETATLNSLVLISDRGRGKSAALGIVMAKLIQKRTLNIVITAPRLKATDIVFQHLSRLLPESMIKKGVCQYKGSQVKFYSPDECVRKNIQADILFVDEAAAIPIPLLTQLLKQFPQCIFSTTIHGYEGTGRGFSLKFYKVLDELKRGWVELKMQQPVRWSKNDPLEKWMFELLCLDAEANNNEKLEHLCVDKNLQDNLNIKIVTQEELIIDNARLKNIFSFLVMAHYRTKPSDLVRLLDDNNLTVVVAEYHGVILGVVLLNVEGSLSHDLSTEIYQGSRRPAGNLLAQSLTYHCGIEYAGTYRYARIMRIAVSPELHGKGIGTALLDYIKQCDVFKNCDAIGSSFGMNKQLLKFWQKSDFKVVRIGFKREQTSGEHTAMMLFYLSDKGKSIQQEAVLRFAHNAVYWFEDVLNDISTEIKIGIKTNKKSLLEDLYADKDLYSYLHYSRNYEINVAAINQNISINCSPINNADFPEDFSKVLLLKTQKLMNWKQISQVMRLKGQSYARQLFLEAMLYLNKTR